MMNKVTAYPLRWPEGWPRTTARKRSAQYRVTFQQAYAAAQEELRRFKAFGVVISTDVPLRRNGLPYSDGRELFGEDQTKWRFVCPRCGLEMSIEKARDEYAEQLPRLRSGDYRVEQECVGRHLEGVGCDWAAYGLFHGPVFVDGTPVFDFAGKPFTQSKAAGGIGG